MVKLEFLARCTEVDRSLGKTPAMKRIIYLKFMQNIFRWTYLLACLGDNTRYSKTSIKVIERVHHCVFLLLLGSLSTRVFETRTATGSELISLLTYPHTTTFTLLSIFSPSLKISSRKSGRHYGPSTRNVLFRLSSASQKRACLSSLLLFHWLIKVIKKATFNIIKL